MRRHAMGALCLAASCAHSRHEGHYAHDFDDPKHWAAIFDAPDRDEWQKPAEVIRLLGLEAGMVVADIGAGTGYFLPHLSAAVGPAGKVLALDVEPTLVEHMKQRAQEAQLGNVETRVVAPGDPGLESGTLDRALIVNTWHHIPERSRYAMKLKDSLRSGGHVVIVDYTAESPHGPPVAHRIPAEEVIATLREAGLEAEVAEEDLPLQYVVIARNPGTP